MIDRMVHLLEKKVSQLVQEYETIQEENAALKKKLHALTKELEDAHQTSSTLRQVEDRIVEIINTIDTLTESQDGRV